MKYKWILTTVLCIMASFAGGFCSNYFYPINSAHASKDKNLKVIEANEFRIVDSKGKLKATFGMRKVSQNTYAPSLRLLTKAYGSDSGILLEASDYRSSINIYGANAEISMDVSKLSGGRGVSSLQVASRPTIDILDENPKERDSSCVRINSGVGMPEEISIVDDENNKRAILGYVNLVEKATGAKLEYPFSLTFFDKNGAVNWRAP